MAKTLTIINDRNHKSTVVPIQWDMGYAVHNRDIRKAAAKILSVPGDTFTLAPNFLAKVEILTPLADVIARKCYEERDSFCVRLDEVK